MFDVTEKASAIAAEDTGIDLPILDEADEPAMFGGTPVERDGETVIEGAKPVTIGISGMNSARYRKAEAWQRKVLRSLGGRVQTGEEQLLMQSEFVARCCFRWAGFSRDGEPLPFSTENATYVFTKLPFVQRQVERAMGNGGLFRPKIAPT